MAGDVPVGLGQSCLIFALRTDITEHAEKSEMNTDIHR
jgi:hypothetical protein